VENVSRVILLPLQGIPVCGHNTFGMAALGREESILVVEVDGVEYGCSWISHGCSECEEAQKKRMRKQVRELKCGK
jgi:hypothetical protein